MKKKLMVYYIIIGLVCIVSVNLYFSFLSTSVFIDYEEEITQCTEYLNFSDAEREKYDKTYHGSPSIEECEYVISGEGKPASFFLLYERVMTEGLLMWIFPFFAPLLFLFPLVYTITSELNSNYIKYYLLRKKYKNYVFDLFKKSYKYIIIVLLMLAYVIIASLIKSNFNMDPTLDVLVNSLGRETLMFYNDYKPYVIYFVVIILNLLTYVNITLIVLRYNHKNFLISMIESFLAIYLWWVFTFVIVGVQLDKYMGIMSEQVNLLEMYTWHSITDPNIYLITNIIYFVISLGIALYAYRDKEKFIMKGE